MKRFDTRHGGDSRLSLAFRHGSATAGLAIGGLLVATALTSCGAGQISQTATQAPAVNGTAGGTGNIVLRDVHLQAVQTGDALRPGTSVDLVFTATNQSPDSPDKLVGITSDIGTVSVTGDATVPPSGSLAVGTPDGVEALDAVEAADAASATVDLSEPISNGLNYEFTFTFAKAGQTTLKVPISAGSAPRQEVS